MMGDLESRAASSVAILQRVLVSAARDFLVPGNLLRGAIMEIRSKDVHGGARRHVDGGDREALVLGIGEELCEQPSQSSGFLFLHRRRAIGERRAGHAPRQGSRERDRGTEREREIKRETHLEDIIAVDDAGLEVQFLHETHFCALRGFEKLQENLLWWF